ncbi:Wall-associated receptor kinase-like 8 [Bienertia sinuspersici]
MIRLLLLLLLLESMLWLAFGMNISKHNCVDYCGDVKIPYPFGVGANCFHDKWFEIICDGSVHPSRPLLRHFNPEVLDINWPGRYSPRDPQWHGLDRNAQKLKVNLLPGNFCISNRAKDVIVTPVVHSINFGGSPYRFSRWSGEILSGCASVCAKDGATMNSTNCYGVGCCQASLLSSPTSYYLEHEEGLDSYQIALDHVGLPNSKICNISAALIESNSVKNLSGKLSNLKAFPTILEWNASLIALNMLDQDYDNISCSYYFNNVIMCTCRVPYEGNPYLPYGCQVVEECHKCRHHCAFNYTSNYYYCKNSHLLKWASILGFSLGAGLILLVLGCYWLYRFVKRRKEIKQKARYFKKNGGLLLQQQMSSNEGVVETTKVFLENELEKATDGFNENRILGQGGQGTVYKGMLEDGRIVAIKKSKKVDESQLEQFINEVVILSQINHRNVVKLLGCCLETEVPLLVYEFIPNGTLYQHIHYGAEDFHVSWKMRLQIAAESASALSYLHSSSSAPIYHRDIKLSNILLDDKYKAKISDFGPQEPLPSNKLIFGVVLVELLTGKKPICPNKDGGWISLAVEFLSCMESSRLSDILDARIADEAKEEEFVAVAYLARQCLDMKGKQRPTMKEISVLLDGIRSHHSPNFKELIPAESEHVITETVSTESGPYSVGMFSSSESPSGSIEVQPLMVDI